MDWLDKMNGSLSYIEDNLTSEVDIAEAAKRACCSSFNFQRMFSFMADVSIAEYIRRRRLSMAAMELISTQKKVIDIALEYGYESPVSFTRAFTAVHGITPSEVKKSGAKIKAYPRISFEITIKGVEPMNYRIEKVEEFRVVGFKEKFNITNGDNLRRIPLFWGEMQAKGNLDKMMQYCDNSKMCCLGVCTDYDESHCEYYIAAGSNKEIPSDMVELTIPANTYAIFECVGQMPNGQQNTWKRIFSEWLPSSSYELADGPQIEWYSDGDMDSDDYRSEAWIPVRSKK